MINRKRVGLAVLAAAILWPMAAPAAAPPQQQCALTLPPPELQKCLEAQSDAVDARLDQLMREQEVAQREELGLREDEPDPVGEIARLRLQDRGLFRGAGAADLSEVSVYGLVRPRAHAPAALLALSALLAHRPVRGGEGLRVIRGWQIAMVAMAFSVATQSSRAADPASMASLIDQQIALHPQQTGAFVLEKGSDALVARAWLADHARESIDVQYFIWSTDNIGILAAEALLRAAERGVNVRVIVDDLLIDAPDRMLLALARNPRI